MKNFIGIRRRSRLSANLTSLLFFFGAFAPSRPPPCSSAPEATPPTSPALGFFVLELREIKLNRIWTFCRWKTLEFLPILSGPDGWAGGKGVLPVPITEETYNLSGTFLGFSMGLSKAEVNLRRLLAAAPNQQNHAKLIHYVTTSRELLEQIGAEAAAGGISSISKAKLNEYSEKIETLAARLSVPEQEPVDIPEETSVQEIVSVSKDIGSHINPTTLRRRTVAATKVEDRNQESAERDMGAPVKLDVEAQAHIEKHRKLQDDLTDEMVALAKQLKESSLMMNKSLHETEKVLDSTEKAVEQSLASTGRANDRAVKMYSESSKTTCFTWLIIFFMASIFIMVVLLIRIT